MTVTDIKTVTKQKFQIEIDGQPAFVLYRGELFRYKIEKDHEISPEIYCEITEEVLVKRAKLRAMHLLEKMDRTKADLRRKLEQGGYPANAVDAALEYVESFHYIDDAKYASSYISARRNVKGRARLKMELMHKGVDAAVIDEAFEELQDEIEPRDAIRELLMKKRRTEGPMEEKEKQRLYAFFMRRGFSSSDILSVFRENEQK